MATDLDTVFTSAGIDNVHFFNGRLLTAEDLRSLATADAEHRRRLGRCIGEGVAQGLRVAALGGRLVRVSAGLALTTLGDVVDLPVDVDVDLGSPAVSDPSTAQDPLFHECPGSASDALGIGGAVYVLTVRPAARLAGEAPMATSDGTGSSCGPRFSREGVRFRRVLVDLEDLLDATGVPTGPLSLATPAGADVVRSLTAHLFLGTPWLLGRLADVLGAHPLRDAWTRTRLEVCEVPIALVGMRGTDVVFVDEWGVRRSPVRLPRPQPDAGDDPAATGSRASSGWEYLLGADRRQEGLATVSQFQDQLAGALVPGQPLRAVEHFSYLPAVGLLPAVPELVADVPDGGGMVFFTGLGHRTGLSVAADQVETAIRNGAQAPPVDVRFAPGRLLVFDVEGTVRPVRLFVREGHPLAVEADLVDIRERFQALQTRVEALESEDETPAGVLVRPPKLPVVVSEGQTVQVEFSVLVSTAGEYRVDPPTLSLRSLVQVPGLSVGLSGPATFTTTGRELRGVGVTVTWRRRKPLTGGGRLAPRGGEFAAREIPGTTVPLLPPGGGVVFPGIGDPAGTKTGAVRLRVEGPEDSSDVADAPIVLST